MLARESVHRRRPRRDLGPIELVQLAIEGDRAAAFGDRDRWSSIYDCFSEGLDEDIIGAGRGGEGHLDAHVVYGRTRGGCRNCFGWAGRSPATGRLAMDRSPFVWLAESTVDWFIISKKYYLLTEKVWLISQTSPNERGVDRYNTVCYWEWSYTQMRIEWRNNFGGECNGDSGCRNIHLPKPWCHSSSVQWTQMTWRLTLQTSVRILLVVEMILFLQAVPETIMSSNVHVFVSKILVANPYENSGP